MHRPTVHACYAVLSAAMALGLVQHTHPIVSAQSRVPTATRSERLKERDKLDKQASTLRSQGKFIEALQAATAMLAIERDVLGETSDDAIGSIKLIANLHQDRGDWEAARKSRSEALALLTKKLGNDDWQVADARWALANIDLLMKLDDRTRRKLLGLDEREREANRLYARRQLADALRAERDVVAIRKEIQGEKTPDYATSLTYLGTVLRASRQDAEALRLYLRVLEIRQEIYQRPHPSVVGNLDHLANLWYDYGNFAEARRCVDRAWRMRQALYPKEKYPTGHAELALGLYNVAIVCQGQGAYAEACTYYKQSLAMREALYPKETYPQGHYLLILSLNGLGTALSQSAHYAQARRYLERALKMNQTLYPKEKYPLGHPQLAVALSNLASALQNQGAGSDARRYGEQALAMREALYPKEQFPQGHRDVAISLNNLGTLLTEQGNFRAAQIYFERALAMQQSLYPADRFPASHPDVATALINLGTLLGQERKYADARPYIERALEIRRGLYTRQRYPQGHPELAKSLDALGDLYAHFHHLPEARTYLEDALKMKQTLFSKQLFPGGHPVLVESLNNLGIVLEAQGDYEAARQTLQQALDMLQTCYPRDAYPQGHYSLATGLINLGHLLELRGQHTDAWRLLDQGASMYCDLDEVFIAAASEAAALDYISRAPSVLAYLMSSGLNLRGGTEAVYRHVWRTKATVARTLRRRQAVLSSRAASDPATRQTIADWNNCRQELASLMLTSFDGRASIGRLQRLRQLSLEKERLESKLAESLPDFARERRLEKSTYAELPAALPDGIVVIDLLRYVRAQQIAGQPGILGWRADPSYVGFVLAQGRQPRLVDLGLAAPIDQAVREWRAAIAKSQPSESAAFLRRAVWEPLARELPPGTATVLIAPDGSLTAIPWGALPGDRPGSVLLERYALCVVPHAPFVLDVLTAPKRKIDDHGTLLAMSTISPMVLTSPGELDMVIRLAGTQPVTRLDGASATMAAVLHALPLARWCHFDTHGFFADATEQSVLRPDEDPFHWLQKEGPAVIARNPLVLSGIALAAVDPSSLTPQSQQADGQEILSAEAIAGLPLEGLELAVLSACETGIGTVAGGEGVFGLQRAFHLAGARSVIASLWKVQVQATRALMVEFYKNMWNKHLPKLEALRQAQLTVMRQNSRNDRTGPAEGQPPGQDDHDQLLPPFYWAGFMLSGDWR